eukprot:TRINITY_DN7379_c0_g1_i1.p1 TRINITY_DN7379_c0_g1~~TRINITY_DN7379_c0_g1_i1.p1  ORF type:complete len:156 (-),score=33.47 TRINITY_DN7379_c0_g1_i1:145-612(-)
MGSLEEIKKIADLDLSAIKKLPFQAQLKYTTLCGMKCVRVLTKQQEITFDKEEAMKKVVYNILSTNAIKQSAKMAKKGNYREAQANAYQWKKVLKNTEVYEDYMIKISPLYQSIEQQHMEDISEHLMYGGGVARAGFSNTIDRIVTTVSFSSKTF